MSPRVGRGDDGRRGMSGPLTSGEDGPGVLRELLARDVPVVAPGAYDALSARLVQMCGFHAVYMTGFGVTALRGIHR